MMSQLLLNERVRSADMLDLTLPAHLFPPDVIIVPTLPSPDYDSALQIGSISAYWDGGCSIAVYHVRRYASAWQAKHKRILLQHVYSTARQTRYLWVAPSDLHSTGSLADAFAVRCGPLSGRLRCDLLARYQTLVVSFRADIATKTMVVEDMMRIVEHIDAQVVNQLPGKHSPRSN